MFKENKRERQEITEIKIVLQEAVKNKATVRIFVKPEAGSIGENSIVVFAQEIDDDKYFIYRLEDSETEHELLIEDILNIEIIK